MSAPARYRKRPIEVTAIQWTGDNEDECRAFAPSFHAVPPEDRSGDPDVTAQVDGPITWEPLYTGDWVVCAGDVGDVGYDVVSAQEFGEKFELVTAPIPAEAVEAAKRDLRAACCVDEDCECERPINWMAMTGDTVTGVEGDVDEIVRVVLNAAAPHLAVTLPADAIATLRPEDKLLIVLPAYANREMFEEIAATVSRGLGPDRVLVIGGDVRVAVIQGDDVRQAVDPWPDAPLGDEAVRRCGTTWRSESGCEHTCTGWTGYVHRCRCRCGEVCPAMGAGAEPGDAPAVVAQERPAGSGAVVGTGGAAGAAEAISGGKWTYRGDAPFVPESLTIHGVGNGVTVVPGEGERRG